jgi:hypothetical protein
MPRIQEASVVQQTFAVAARLLICGRNKSARSRFSLQAARKGHPGGLQNNAIIERNAVSAVGSSITSFDRHAL